METASRHSFKHRGLTLSYLDSAPGEQNRPVVLLLHGFPDQASMWQPQIAALHQAGYRCIAPDTVGCGESAIAPKLGDYHCETVAADHIALLDQLNIKTAHVAGHDWGAVIAWLIAGHYPQRTLSLVAMSVGHPTAYGRSGLKQKLKGWYTFFFMMGSFAERLLRGEGRFSLRQVFRSHPDMNEVMPRVRQPGRLRAALRLYRNAIVPILIKKQPVIAAPTLGLWSEDDRFLVEAQMRASEKYCSGPFNYQRLPGHHWMSLAQPETINQLMLEHWQNYNNE